ncbi:hypothetical protein SAMN04487969_11753 [Paenibacillus algorifonticola]|uniref:Uncharacterized protein n=1 Tax=Paenibacillus algorifonticola TaxID=684063 RepID=A0A1I2GP20_9BACL|nr:hypothetical protein SAMN04487969_11753 [Paenibacillus algorifonticola]
MPFNLVRSPVKGAMAIEIQTFHAAPTPFHRALPHNYVQKNGRKGVKAFRSSSYTIMYRRGARHTRV